MAASVNDKFLKVGVAGTLTSLSAPGKALAASSINIGSGTNWPTDTGVLFAIRQVGSSGVLVAGTYTEWVGTLSGTTISGLTGSPAYGSDQVYPAGTTTQVFIPVSSYAHNRLIDGVLVQHNQDGTHGSITTTGTINTSTVSSLQDTSVALSTYRKEAQQPFVASGGVWTGDAYASTKAASMTALVCYINGRRISIGAVTARTFTASKDTYVDVLDNADGTGTLVYTEVTNNAASPALAANSLRLAIVVTGATNIAAAGSINQGDPACVLPIASSVAYSVTDSLGNLICNRNPNPTQIGYRQVIANQTGISSTDIQVTGLSCPVIVPTGRRVKIIAHYPQLIPVTAFGTHRPSLWDGVVASGTQLQKDLICTSNSDTTALSGTVSAVALPATASKTYNAGMSNSAAGGSTTSITSAATAPSYISVELI